ncbi:ATP-binding protein [Streptacidiphilus melanogenes]|uniref:ATP-binding protein n=1 Tax=Streptacidiphilus melanogenes TaxID=411235 RepID=UPI0006937A2C|nr:tetratricopeptide repeat protein [Streptacidiphilus melanogenes]
MPDPDRAEDLAGFVGLLDELRAWAGMPSYRVLAKRVGAQLRPARDVSPSTIVDLFKMGRRRLDLDLVVAIVRALGADAPTVARWRQACVRVHAEARTGGTSGVLRQLPAELATFTGRERELGELLAQAVGSVSGARRSTVVISAIEGMAGVGKTQLAVHAAHRLAAEGHFADLQLYVNLRGFDAERPPADPASVLEAFLRQLGIPSQRIPADVDERAALFRDQLHDRRALLLLDNAADERQVRDLIPAGGNCLVLVTSRRRLTGLDGAWPIVLGTFTDDESTELLVRIVGPDRVRAEPRAAAELVRECGGLPLAVAIVAARLRSRPAWKLADLVRHLRTDPAVGLREGNRSPWPVFRLSYDGLPGAARRVFRLLAAHPGRDVTVGSTAALAGLDAGHAHLMVELLADEHLLQPKEFGRYEMHDLLRVFAREVLLAEEPAAARDAAVSRLLKWYAVVGVAAQRAVRPDLHSLMPPSEWTAHPAVHFGSEAEAMTWAEREVTNLLAAVNLAHGHGDALMFSRLFAAVAWYLGIERRWHEVLAVGEAMLKTVPDARDEAATAWLRLGMAAALEETGRPESAEPHLVAALDTYRRLGDHNGQLAVLNRSASCASRAGRQDAAFTFVAEALSIARLSEDWTAAAKILNSRAISHHQLHRPQEALKDLEEALSCSRSGNNGQLVATLIRNLGFTYLVLEDHIEAEARFAEAGTLFHKLGDTFRHAESLHGAARALYGQGRVAEARRSAARGDDVLGGAADASAGHQRRRLESSPLRYIESAAIEGTARA